MSITVPKSIRVAFYGRAAARSDGMYAISQQIRSVSTALPACVSITGSFADFGPWSGLYPGAQGVTDVQLDGHLFSGGIHHLLHQVVRPDPQFDVVACSDRERLSRRLAERVRLEDVLAEQGVQVFAATDPPADLFGPARRSALPAPYLPAWPKSSPLMRSERG